MYISVLYCVCVCVCGAQQDLLEIQKYQKYIIVFRIFRQTYSFKVYLYTKINFYVCSKILFNHTYFNYNSVCLLYIGLCIRISVVHSNEFETNSNFSRAQLISISMDSLYETERELGDVCLQQ